MNRGIREKICIFAQIKACSTAWALPISEIGFVFHDSAQHFWGSPKFIQHSPPPPKYPTMPTIFPRPTKAILALTLLAATLLASGCQSKYGDASDRRIADEEKAEILLNDARAALKAGDYAAAKSKVKTMRQDYPYALACRKAGILLMDSIELMVAKSDTTQEDREMRINFYLKKLRHDHAELSKGNP